MKKNWISQILKEHGLLTNDDGFTFAETIAVLAIMLVLTAGVGISASKYVEKARILSAKNQIEIFKLALQSYYMDCGVFPSDSQGLKALYEKPFIHPIPENWAGPYLDKEVNKDPWGNEYKYSRKKNGGLPFTIISTGADGNEGGENENSDIVSWK